MKGYKYLYAAVLFFVLSPGVLIRFPAKDIFVVAGTHALLFALLLYVSCRCLFPSDEGFEDAEKKRSFTDLIVIWVVKNIIGVDVN